MFNKKPIKLLYLLFLLLFIIILINILFVNLTGVHLVSGNNISAYKKERDTKTEQISAKRGSIYDRNGEVIAKESNTYTIIAYLNKDRIDRANNKPAYVTDPDVYATKLSKILKADADEIKKLLLQENLYQTYLGSKGKGLSLSQKEQIEALKLPGIEFETSTSRYYPNGTFASSTIGYASFDEQSNKLVGKLGVEGIYDDYLSGENGYSKYVVDGLGLKQKELDSKKAVNGSDVYLTIDNNIQRIVESNMEELFKVNKPEMAFAVVANAKTGEILALTNRPTFNPNILDIKDYTNPFVSLQFEPGSTMKSFTYASAMDSNAKYKGSNKFNSAPRCIVANGICVQKVQNFDNNNWGNISYDLGFMRSSNIGILSMFDNYLPTKTFEAYLDKFHFFKETGIEIAGEAKGSKQMEIKQEAYTTGFGQSSSVTPVQMLQAFTAFTNNGVMLKPYITKKIIDENDQIQKEFEKTEVGRAISEKTSKDMLKLLTKVVEDPQGGGNRYYKTDSYKIAGKTGTAEYVENGKYLTCGTCYYNSFIGAAPASNPEIVFYMITKREGATDHNPYDTRGQFIKNITSNILAYLNSKPDKKITKDNEKIKLYEIESFINKSVAYASKKLDNMNMEYLIIGDGKTIINQSITPYQKTSNKQKILLLTDSKKYTMDNLTGFSKSEVLKYAQLLNLKVEIKGEGYVYSQSIVPGTSLNDKSKLLVKLK